MRLLFASPTYGPIDSKVARTQRVAIMHAANHAGVQWAGDVSPDRMKFDTSRNRVVSDALEQSDELGVDGVFWCDSDILLPPDGISTLVSRGYDFVTGLYVQREPPHMPMVAHFDPTVKSFRWLMQWPPKSIVPVDGCGFGCVYTSTKLLRAVGREPFHYGEYGEDLTFCLKAMGAKIQLWFDPSVECIHQGNPVEVGMDTARRFHANRLREQSYKAEDDERTA